MTTPAKLVKLIRKHGHEACVKPNGALHVSSDTVTRDWGTGMLIRRRYTNLPATMPAVLAWLGY